MIKKNFRNLTVFLIVIGIFFSNVPYYTLNKIIDAYISTANIVDKAWHIQKNSNVVDKFTSLHNIAEKIRVQEAYAASPTFVNAGATANSAGSVAVGLPASIQTNDILLLFIETENQ